MNPTTARACPNEHNDPTPEPTLCSQGRALGVLEFIERAVGVVRFIRGRWVHSVAPWGVFGSLGESFGFAGFIRASPGGNRVR